MLCVTMKVLCLLSCVLFSILTTGKPEKGFIFSKSCRNQYDCNESVGYVCGQNQTCHCDRFFVFYEDKCLGGVGQKCKYDEHCIHGAFCEFQKRCQCKDDLYPSDDGFACSSKSRNFMIFDVFIITGVMIVYWMIA